MKVILTNKKEKSNLKQITDLLNLILFDYNVEVIEKKKEQKKKSQKDIKETKRVVIEKIKKNAISDLEKRQKEKEWLEDYYYSQNKDREEMNRLVNYYSNTKRISNYY